MFDAARLMQLKFYTPCSIEDHGSCSQTVISLGHSRLLGDNRPQTGRYPRAVRGELTRDKCFLSSGVVAAMHLPMRYVLCEILADGDKPANGSP
jgi:hypothetical protein